MYEKRGNTTSIDKCLNSKILIAVPSIDERNDIETRLKRYGYSKNDYSIASGTSEAKKMLEGVQVVITNDPAVAMYSNGSQVIRTDIRDDEKEKRKLEEKFNSVLEGKVEQYKIKGNLLMISDDVSSLNTYQKELWDLGYRTKTIVDKGDGRVREESIRYIAEGSKTDAIIMDCEDDMDTTSGLMLLLILRGDFPNIPIIGRYNNKKVKESAIRYGANAGIKKSADGSDLYNMIEGLLNPQKEEEPKVEEVVSVSKPQERKTAVTLSINEEDILSKLAKSADRAREEMSRNSEFITTDIKPSEEITEVMPAVTSYAGSQILFVDGVPLALSMYQPELEKAGYKVKTASNKESALSIIDQGGIDLVITDILLGDSYDGFSVLNKAKTENVPSIVYTGDEDPTKDSFAEQLSCAYAVITRERDSIPKLINTIAEALSYKTEKEGQSPTPLTDGTVDNYIDRIKKAKVSKEIHPLNQTREFMKAFAESQKSKDSLFE